MGRKKNPNKKPSGEYPQRTVRIKDPEQFQEFTALAKARRNVTTAIYEAIGLWMAREKERMTPDEKAAN